MLTWFRATGRRAGDDGHRRGCRSVAALATVRKSVTFLSQRDGGPQKRTYAHLHF